MAELIIRPTSDISTSGYVKQPSSSPNFYSLVDEVVSDGDTTYFYTTSTNNRITLGCLLPNDVNYKITSIELVVASANEVQQGGGSTNSCTAGLSINNQEYSYTFSSNTTSYNPHSHLFEFSNDLYFKDITSLNIFVGNFANTNNKLYTKITQIYLNVNYEETVEPPKEYSININATNISHNIPDTVLENNNISGIFTPNTGYTLPQNIVVTMNNSILSNNLYSYNSVTGQFELDNISGNITIDINAVPIYFSVITNLNNIELEEVVENIRYGETLYLHFIAKEGYSLPDKISVIMGDSELSNSNYTYLNGNLSIENVIGDISISASATILTFIINTTISSGSGTITPTSIVNYGDDFLVEYSPNNGYYTSKILIDNIESEINTQFTFYGIKENHTVEVFFSPIASEKSQTIFRIDNLQNTFISGEIIENNENNIIIDKFGNVFMNEFIEDSNNKISPTMSFYINEIKEGYNFGTN